MKPRNSPSPQFFSGNPFLLWNIFEYILAPKYITTLSGSYVIVNPGTKQEEIAVPLVSEILTRFSREYMPRKFTIDFINKAYQQFVPIPFIMANDAAVDKAVEYYNSITGRTGPIDNRSVRATIDHYFKFKNNLGSLERSLAAIEERYVKELQKVTYLRKNAQRPEFISEYLAKSFLNDPQDGAKFFIDKAIAEQLAPGSSHQIPETTDAIPAGLSKQQREYYVALQKLMKDDLHFKPTLISECEKRGINPDYLLNMLAIESAFNKSVDNGKGYIGLGQVGQQERKSIGWSGNDQTDVARLRTMSASEQLKQLVFPFMEMKFGSALRGITLDKMYAAWGSGHYSNDPNYVHMQKKGKRSKAYKNNPGWDYNKDGKTEQWEFGPAAVDRLGAGKVFTWNTK